MERLDIYPWPQWLKRLDGRWSVRQDDVTLWLGEACRPVAEGAARVLDVWRLTARPAGGASEAAVVVGALSEREVAARLSRHPALLAEALPPEGYVLALDDAGATVGGADARGCLYGLSSLAQLLRLGREAGSLPYLELRDWPFKPMRGVHLYMPGREDIPFFKRLLAWLASLKYNLLFLEVGGGMRYDRHPEVNEAWARFCDEARAYPGGPQALQGSQPYPKDSTHTELGGGRWLEKEEISGLVGYANSLGIEVVPELQALSHAYYMVLAHPDIAERAYDPWPDTYCPSNPKSYELYFDLLDEVIELFRPRMVHIGHDEAYTIGVCDRCRGKSGAELLAADLRKIHDYLAGRGIRTVLWGDKLQNIIVGGVDHGGRARMWVEAERKADHTMRETYQAVDFVPKDMLIMDWYWCLDPNSERFFQRKGFEVIFGNFGNNFDPQTFYGWDKRAIGTGVTGAEVSTWCRVAEYAFGHNLSLYNLLFSANMLWWSHYTDRERGLNLTHVARLQPLTWQAITGGSLPSQSGAVAHMVALGAGQASPLALEGIAGSWTGASRADFQLGERAIAVSAATPVSIDIAIGRRAAGLAFLHHCQTQREPRPTWSFQDFEGKGDYNLLGQYLVTYSDGSSEGIEIRYGDNISRPDLVYGEDQAACPFWAQPAWEGRDRESGRVTLWSHEWVNPRPEKEITGVSLRFRGDHPLEQIVLLALTALG